MHIVDWLPTLVSAAGIDINHVTELNYTLDGVDHYQGIIGNVTSENNNNLFRDTLYYGLCTVPYLKYDAVQYKGYKLVNQSGGSPNQWFPPPDYDDGDWITDIDSFGKVLGNKYIRV